MTLPPHATIRLTGRDVTVAGRGSTADWRQLAGWTAADRAADGGTDGPRLLALAGAVALAARQADPTTAVAMALAALRQGCDGPAARLLARLREVAGVTPPADLSTRLWQEAQDIQADLLAEEQALTIQLRSLFQAAALAHPGRGLIVLAEAGCRAAGLDAPGPVDRACALAAADGLPVTLAPLVTAAADRAGTADLVLLAGRVADAQGTILCGAEAVAAAAVAGGAGTPVWVLLPGGRIDWAGAPARRHGTADLAGAGLLGSALAGLVTERGHCPPTGAGLAGLYPERAQTPTLAPANEE